MRHVVHSSARRYTADAAGYVAELAESLRCGGGTGARRRRGGRAAFAAGGAVPAAGGVAVLCRHPAGGADRLPDGSRRYQKRQPDTAAQPETPPGGANGQLPVLSIPRRRGACLSRGAAIQKNGVVRRTNDQAVAQDPAHLGDVVGRTAMTATASNSSNKVDSAAFRCFVKCDTATWAAVSPMKRVSSASRRISLLRKSTPMHSAVAATQDCRSTCRTADTQSE